ncbi:hypothetical protein ACLK1T_05175 [Escherichia coli]
MIKFYTLMVAELVPRDRSADVYQPAFWYSRRDQSICIQVSHRPGLALTAGRKGLAWLMPTVVMVVRPLSGSRAGRQVTSSAH